MELEAAIETFDINKVASSGSLLAFRTWDGMYKYLQYVTGDQEPGVLVGNSGLLNVNSLENLANNLGVERILLERYEEDSDAISEIYIDIEGLDAIRLVKALTHDNLWDADEIEICKRKYLRIWWD